MFEGFALQHVDAGGIAIRARHRLTAGRPPLLLLHGNPQTHYIWHAVAPRLAARFSVVATDLTGYGESAKPGTTPDRRGGARGVLRGVSVGYCERMPSSASSLP